MPRPARPSASGAPPLAVVTGASSGIGRELARLAAADGYRTLLVARRQERLAELAAELREATGLEARVAAADLTREAGLDAVAEAVGGDAIEVLVNNAGFATWGPVEDTTEEALADVIALNIAALTRLTRRFLPSMRSHGRGFVLNVASTGAFLPGPDLAAYYASKAYVLSFSEALGEELRGSGVVVTCLCPGPTRTEFHEVAGMGDAPFMDRLWFMSAGRAAAAGWSGLTRGRPLVIPGVINRLTAWAPRLLPRLLVPRIVGAVQSARRSPP